MVLAQEKHLIILSDRTSYSGRYIGKLSESHYQSQIWSLYTDDNFSPAQVYCHLDDSTTRWNLMLLAE